MDIDLTGRGGPAGSPGAPPPGFRPGRRPASPLRILFSLFGSIGMLPLFFVAFAGAPSCMGFEDPTLAVIERCPPAIAALGSPVHRSWVGASCGNAEEEGSSGNASWTFPVAGPNGSGSVSVVAFRSGGPWVVRSAMVSTSAGSFEAVSCAASSGAPPIGAPTGPMGAPTASGPPPSIPLIPSIPGLPGIPGLTPGAPMHLSATVATASTGAPATLGESCTIDVTPAGLGAPCAVAIGCGGRPLYASATPSHAMCLPGGHGGTTAIDASDADGDGIVTVTSESGTGSLTSTTPTWLVTFSFPPTP